MTPRVACVVLTQGQRPEELRHAVDSVLAQRAVIVDVVVVCNGGGEVDVPPGVKVVLLPTNVGIPRGRNRGVREVAGDYLVFVDDDACLPTPDVLADVIARMVDDPTLGLVQPRFADPDGRPTPRQWVPRLRVGDPARSSDVCAVCEAVVVVRRPVFESVGGWPDCFHYAHEGVDLAWRVWNAGYRVHYAGDIVIHHPAVSPLRHEEFYRFTARNRVLLARRQLPVPVAAIYIGVWVFLTLARARGLRPRIKALRGFIEGFHTSCGTRRPLTWRTMWRMTRAGRPPII